MGEVLSSLIEEYWKKRRAPLLYHASPVAAQIMGHIAGPSSPSPLRTMRGFIFIARIFQHFSSLVESRRMDQSNAKDTREFVLS